MLSALTGKNVLIGISGSIAAYKIPMLVRLMVKQQCSVRVIMTSASADFVSPLTLSTLCGSPVHVDFFDRDAPQLGWNNHVDLGLWADVFIVAPLSSNTLSKMASGQSDNLLLATFMSVRCPVFFAPAMDVDMYHNGATTSNIQLLESRGYHCIPSEYGELASGLVGEGRMAEPENILAFVEKTLKQNLPLLGKKVLINAGPTHEAIDPVRFIGNHSSGKMGHALAQSAKELGADVTLVMGPTNRTFSTEGMRFIRVESAYQMLQECTKAFADCDIAIFSAAVADYRPVSKASSKIKKKDAPLSIELEPTEDILKTLGHKKSHKQVVIGFALETENAEENARGKRIAKNADFIIGNTKGEGTGFAYDTNEVFVIGEQGDTKHFPKTEKTELAKQLWAYFIDVLAY